MEIKKVGIVGCGVMGSGITQLCAQSGYEVMLAGRNEERLKKRLESVDEALKRSVEKGKITQETKDETFRRIKGTISTKDLSECDLVIESVPEKMDLKKEVFVELDTICHKKTLLATNTGVLSIIDMAIVTSRPERVLGLHFMNPAPSMKLVEIVKTILTSKETLEAAKELCKSLGKTFVIAKDRPGFIINIL